MTSFKTVDYISKRDKREIKQRAIITIFAEYRTEGLDSHPRPRTE